MSGAYGQKDRKESVATIHEAVSLGVNLLDTADVYGEGHNEKLIGEAISGMRERVILSSKFGFVGDEHGNVSVCGRPDYVKAACNESLKRLGTDYIDIYHLHRVDPLVPIEDTVGAMAELKAEGKIRFLALSEASAHTMRKACSVHRIDFLQSEYSLFSKDIEAEVLPACWELDITLLAFSPLGRGVLTGTMSGKAGFEPGDYRRNMPRFSAENLQKNIEMVGDLQAVADQKGVSVSQLALSWLLHQDAGVIPVVGMTKRKYLSENIAAASIPLSRTEENYLRELTAQVAGERHNQYNLKFIDD